MASVVHGPLGTVLREGGRLGGKFLDRMEPYPPDQAPHGAQQWADYIRASLDPTSAAGLLQLATILVPGGKGGRAGALSFRRPTPAGASLLKAIYESSRLPVGSRLGTNKTLFQMTPDALKLADRIGVPDAQRAAMGDDAFAWHRASNPLRSIIRTGGLGPFEAGKTPPGKFVFDPGGQKLTKFPSGPDVPPLQGELGNYFPAEPQNAAAQVLFNILMGGGSQN